MFLNIGRASHARNDSEDRAQSIVCTVNRIGHPTPAAAVPALTFQDSIKRSPWPGRGSHRVKRARVRLFFERAFAQKISHIFFSSQRAVALIAEFRFMFFFGSFHAANRDIRSRDLVPPAIQTAPKSVFQNRWRLAEVA